MQENTYAEVCFIRRCKATLLMGGSAWAFACKFAVYSHNCFSRPATEHSNE